MWMSCLAVTCILGAAPRSDGPFGRRLCRCADGVGPSEGFGGSCFVERGVHAPLRDICMRRLAPRGFPGCEHVQFRRDVLSCRGFFPVIEFALLIAAVLLCMVAQGLDVFLSRFGVVSAAHGGLLGYGQIYIAKLVFEWGGANLGLLAVIFIAAIAVGTSLYRIRNTWTRWVGAFNFGLLFGLIYGAYVLV